MPLNNLGLGGGDQESGVSVRDEALFDEETVTAYLLPYTRLSLVFRGSNELLTSNV